MTITGKGRDVLHRGVEGVYFGSAFQFVGDGFRVSNYFPSVNRFLQRFSPFILMDYMSPYEWPGTDKARGVGAHPHRGFEAVTFVYQGKVEHHDNAGNHGVIGAGDVQWMTAGAGVLHKEYQEKEFARTGGIMQAIQLWINLPRKDKMVAPRYQTLLAENMGRIELDDNQGRIRIIAGDYAGVKGPAHTFSPITIYDVELIANARIELEMNESFHCGILVLNGSMFVNGKEKVSETQFALLNNEVGNIEVQAGPDGVMFIVLSGEPLNETYIQHGPFVMSNKQEIVDAYDDLNHGKFGSFDF